MKFIDLNNQEHRKNITRYKISENTENKSSGHITLGEKLVSLFPNITIYEELPCFGTRMRLDYYIHTLLLAFEFDGKQHEQYCHFFHQNKRNFFAAKARDEQKEAWCLRNNITLIRVNKNNIDELEKLIHESKR